MKRQIEKDEYIQKQALPPPPAIHLDLSKVPMQPFWFNSDPRCVLPPHTAISAISAIPFWFGEDTSQLIPFQAFDADTQKRLISEGRYISFSSGEAKIEVVDSDVDKEVEDD